MTQPELFDVGPRAPEPPGPGTFGKSSRFGKDTPCVPEPIGSGPAGATCKTCRHAARVKLSSKTVIKCGLMRRYWTGGPGTDIKARWAACRKWEAEI